MNIVVVGKFYSDGFATHIANTFSEMGHHVIAFNPGFNQKITQNKTAYRFQQIKQQLHQFYSYTTSYTKKRRKDLEALTLGKKIHLMLACHDFLFPSEVEFFRKEKKAITALWFPDAMSNFGKAMFLNAGYDFLFFKEPFAAFILQRDFKKNAFYLPECCNPNKHFPVHLSEEDQKLFGCDITTAGNMHTARAAIFELLQDYEVKIWGNPAPSWMDINGWGQMVMNRYIINEEKAKSFKAAKIVLNNMHPTEFYGINVRAFEICACEGFQLINYRPTLKNLFKDGEEIIVYKNVEELKSQINYYLQNEEERKRIAANGAKRAKEQHTYKHRLDLMINTIFGNEKGTSYTIDQCDFSYI